MKVRKKSAFPERLGCVREKVTIAGPDFFFKKSLTGGKWLDYKLGGGFWDTSLLDNLDLK